MDRQRMPSKNVSGVDGNPNSIIQSRLQLLRTEREQTISDISSLEQEKLIIQKILPKVLHELNELRKSLESDRKDLQIYESALQEIEKNYGSFLYSPDFFDSEEI